MRDLRIVFMGTPEFAVGILKSILDEGRNVVGVITAPDKPAGRGRQFKSSAVKEYALSRNLKVLQPNNLKDADFLAELKALKANLQIVVAFRMLPKVVWELPEHGTFNLHASLLPQYRGAAPINWAIINKEKITGVTTFFIDEKIDTGEIILTKETEICSDETFETLHDKLMQLGSELVNETVSLIEQGEFRTTVQPRTGDLKEAPKLTSENTRIDWSDDAVSIDAFIRGLSPYPGSWTILQNNGNDSKVKIYRSSYENGMHNLEAGKLIVSKKQLKVAVTDGYILIEEIQLPGKRKMTIGDLLNGYAFNENSKMS